MDLEQRHPVGGNMEAEIQELLDSVHPRMFLWIVPKPEERAGIVSRLQAEGMTVLDVIWPWHVLACSSEASRAKQVEMVTSFKEAMEAENPWLRGQMFGYPHADIDWYAVILRRTIARAEAFLTKGRVGQLIQLQGIADRAESIRQRLDLGSPPLTPNDLRMLRDIAVNIIEVCQYIVKGGGV